MSDLPACIHRGEMIGDNRCECASNRIMHSRAGVALLSTCIRCRYTQRANIPEEELAAIRAAVEPESVDLSCIHRGPQIREDRCDLCGMKGQPFTVYQCSIHEACSLNKVHSKVKGCAACEDRERSML
jgi:hypothetical protein